jgi:TatD DNase family protein
MSGGKLDLIPLEGGPLVDAHCHVPYPNPPNSIPMSYDLQYDTFIKEGGKFLVTSSVDGKSLALMRVFAQKHEHCYLSAGFAPQTVTYTKGKHLKQIYDEWITYLNEFPNEYISIGEIGLDFHHAKTLEKRNQQIQYFEQILNDTKHLKKPYVLHVRNPSQNDMDKENPDHLFNQPDAVNIEILKMLDQHKINSASVLWHCFAGPSPTWGEKLASLGYYLSVITSSYRNKKMRSYTANVPIINLLTETDSFWQHPLKYHGFNMPHNVKYAIAAIADSHQIDQSTIAHQIYLNSCKFYNIRN